MTDKVQRNLEATNPVSRENLVFDIGLHHGDDSRYYLDHGYRVVGVDANPNLTADCETRFREEIAQGRMVVLNAGILRTSGEFIFYRNLTDAGWSSFLPERGKAGGKFEALPVQCTTLASLVEIYGQPHFIKTDVEGADLEVIDTLDPLRLPQFISCELSPSTDVLGRLISFGYRGFKLLNGATFTSGEPIFDHQVGWRAVRKLTRVIPLAGKMVRALPYGWHHKAEFDAETAGSGYGSHSSGPFGDEAFGQWRGAEETRARLDTLLKNYKRYGMETQFWWDIHARLV